MKGAWVHPLVGKLRSHMLWGVADPHRQETETKKTPLKMFGPRKTMFPEVQHCPSVTFRFQMMDGGVCRSDHLVKE